MARDVPATEGYVDSRGIQHQAQTSLVVPSSESASAIRCGESASPIPPNREKVNEFIYRVFQEHRVKISKTEIYGVAGYKTPRESERWQKGELKSGSAPDVKLNRVLSLSTDEFLEKREKFLKRRETVKQSSSRKFSH